jgi:glycosyltransferase involved in cell wall biosynthesis
MIVSHIKSLSVIIPVYNEEHALPEVMQDICMGLDRSGVEFEVIVVNDGSVDGTERVLSRLESAESRLKVLNHERNMGKGRALRTGLAAASKTWVLIMDADMQILFSEFSAFNEAAETADVVIGYRRYHTKNPLYRKVVSRLYRIVVRILLNIRVRDCGCPFKLFRSEILKSITLSAEGFGIDAELLWRVSQTKVPMIELPVQSNARKTGVSKVTFARCLACIRELFKIRLLSGHP